MAELAGSIAGLVTLAGLAGQGLQAITFLKDFLNEMKDADYDLEDVSQNIESLEDILRYIEGLKANPPARELIVQPEFQKSLQDQLEKCTQDLENFKLQVFVLQPAGKRKAMDWKQRFHKASRKNQFLSIHRQISSHRGKLMLLLLRFIGDLNLAMTYHLRSVQNEIVSLRTSMSSTSANAMSTLRNVQEIRSSLNMIQSFSSEANNQQVSSIVKLKGDVESIMRHIQVPQVHSTLLGDPVIVDSMIKSSTSGVYHSHLKKFSMKDGSTRAIRVVNTKVSICTGTYGHRSQLEMITDRTWENAGDDMKKVIFMQVLALRLLERLLYKYRGTFYKWTENSLPSKRKEIATSRFPRRYNADLIEHARRRRAAKYSLWVAGIRSKDCDAQSFDQKVFSTIMHRFGCRFISSDKLEEYDSVILQTAYNVCLEFTIATQAASIEHVKTAESTLLDVLTKQVKHLFHGFPIEKVLDYKNYKIGGLLSPSFFPLWGEVLIRYAIGFNTVTSFSSLPLKCPEVYSLVDEILDPDFLLARIPFVNSSDDQSVGLNVHQDIRVALVIRIGIEVHSISNQGVVGAVLLVSFIQKLLCLIILWEDCVLHRSHPPSTNRN